MITDLRIHDDERVERADAPDDCNTREFLVDVLHSLHPGSNPRDWTLQNGTPGKSLQLDHTLKQNQVHSHDDLYLVLIKEAPKPEKLQDPIVKPQDLELEITLPDGNTIRSEARPSARPAEILAKIIKRFNLPPSDGKGRPNRWVLVHQKTDRVLDPDNTMVENVLDTGDRLVVKIYGEDLKLEVIGPNEKTRHCEAPPDTKAATLLAELVEFFHLAKVDKKGRPLNWTLVDQKTDRPLDLNQTLAGNDVVSGARLLVQPSDIDLDLQVTAPNGKTRQTQAPPDTRTAEFLADLLASFHLHPSDDKGKPLTWLLVVQKTNKALDPNKTLAESGLITGDRLSLRQPRTPIVDSPFSLRTWLRKPAVLIALVLLGLLLAAVIILKVIPRPPVRVTLQPETARLSPSGTQKFNAAVKNGHSQGVTWSMVPKVGTMSPNGMYTAPPVTKKERQVVVIATSDDDPTKSAEAIVTLLPTVSDALPEPPPEPPPTTSGTENASNPAANPPAPVALDPPVAPPVSPTQLHLQPALAILGASDTRRFAVIPKQDDPVVWSLRPALGTISSNGLYTAPPLIHQKQRVNVTASIGGTSVASAIVTLQPAVLSGITSSTTGENGQMVYATTVSNAKDSTVLWSINPQIGSISAQGVYTPPAGTTATLQAGTNPSQVVTLTARSQADPNQSITAVIHLAPVVTVSLNPFNPRLTNNEHVTLSAMVTGANNHTVTWSAVGPGQIMPFGEYIAPPNVPPGGARVQVRATSNADPVKSATAWITLYSSPTFQGPRQGELTWQGNIKSNNTLTINDSQASSGKISGGLPGVPVQIQVNTGGCQVITYPAPANNWKTIVIQTHAHLHTISISWHVEHQ